MHKLCFVVFTCLLTVFAPASTIIVRGSISGTLPVVKKIPAFADTFIFYNSPQFIAGGLDYMESSSNQADFVDYATQQVSPDQQVKLVFTLSDNSVGQFADGSLSLNLVSGDWNESTLSASTSGNLQLSLLDDTNCVFVGNQLIFYGQELTNAYNVAASQGLHISFSIADAPGFTTLEDTPLFTLTKEAGDDVASYIEVTGSSVPEPSAAVYLLCGVAVLHRWRRVIGRT